MQVETNIYSPNIRTAAKVQTMPVKFKTRRFNSVDISKEKTDNKTTKNIIIGALLAGILIGLCLLLHKKHPVSTPPKSTTSDSPIKPDDITEVLHWKEYDELLEREKVARTEKHKFPQDKEINTLWRDSVANRKAYEDKARKEHFSIIQKQDLSKLTDDEKVKFFENLYNKMKVNEESAIDGLDMFYNYGLRKVTSEESGEVLSTTLSSLLLFSKPKDVSDKLLNRYLDVLEKYMVKNTKNDNREIGAFDLSLTDDIHENSSFYQVITEDTLIRALKLLKRMMYNSPNRIQDLQYRIKLTYLGDYDITNRKFHNSPRKNEIIDVINDLANIEE